MNLDEFCIGTGVWYLVVNFGSNLQRSLTAFPTLHVQKIASHIVTAGLPLTLYYIEMEHIVKVNKINVDVFLDIYVLSFGRPESKKVFFLQK